MKNIKRMMMTMMMMKMREKIARMKTMQNGSVQNMLSEKVQLSWSIQIDTFYSDNKY